MDLTLTLQYSFNLVSDHCTWLIFLLIHSCFSQGPFSALLVYHIYRHWSAPVQSLELFSIYPHSLGLLCHIALNTIIMLMVPKFISLLNSGCTYPTVYSTSQLRYPMKSLVL